MHIFDLFEFGFYIVPLFFLSFVFLHFIFWMEEKRVFQHLILSILYVCIMLATYAYIFAYMLNFNLVNIVVIIVIISMIILYGSLAFDAVMRRRIDQ
jgi:hypothetical protein